MEETLSLLFVLFVSFIFVKFVLIVELRKLFRILKLRRHGLKAIGTVIAFRTEADSDGPDTYSPIVGFYTPDREEYIILSDDFRMLQPNLGEIVRVFYDRQNPSLAVIDPVDTIFRTVVAMLILIAILLTLNIAFIALFFGAI